MDFIVAAIIFSGVIAVIAASNGKTMSAWTAAARVLGLTFVKKNALSSPRLVGTIDGMNVVVSVRSANNSKSTRYQIEYESLGIGVQIVRKRGLAVLTTFLGAQDAVTGDAAFDELVVIRTNAPDQLPAILTSRGREAITDLMVEYPTAKVTNEDIIFERKGIERDSSRLVRTVQALVTTAKAITGVSSASHAGPESYDMPAPVETPTMPMPAPATAQETPETAGYGVSPDMETSSSIDDSMLTYDSSLTSMTSPSSTADTLGPSVIDQPAVAPLSTGPDPISLGTEMFGGKLLSFEAATTFDQAYSGKKIRWEGTVSKRSDMDTWVDVGSIDTTLYGPISIVAIVSTPVSAKPDDRVVVEGTLVSVDTFERTFAIDGTIRRAGS